MAAESIYGKSSYGSDSFSSAYGKSLYGSSPTERRTTIDEEIIDLEALAKMAGKKDVGNEQGIVINMVDKVGRALNYDVANITGIALGVMRDDITWQQGRSLGAARNTGWSDVYKEAFGEPDTKAGKIALGTAGFVSDIFLSPLTYLSFGTVGISKVIVKEGIEGGVKMAITRKASKFLNQGTKELIESAEERVLKGDIPSEFVSHAEELAKEGMNPLRANALAQKIAANDIDKLTQIILTKTGKGELSKADFEELVQKGLSIKSAEHAMQLGGAILDKGGVKIFGHTLVSSETLAKTPLGRAANRLGEFSIVQTVGKAFKHIWVADAFKDSKVVSIFDKFDRDKRRLLTTLFEKTDGALGKYSEEQNLTLYREADKISTETLTLQKQIFDDNLTKFEELNPHLKGKVKGTDTAEEMYDVLGDISSRRQEDLTKELEANFAKEAADKEARLLSQNSKLPYNANTLSEEDELLREILQENNNLDEVLKKMLKKADDDSDIYAGKLPSDEPGITNVELNATRRLIKNFQYEKMYERNLKLRDRIRKLEEKKAMEASAPKVERALDKDGKPIYTPKELDVAKRKAFAAKKNAAIEEVDKASSAVKKLKGELDYWASKITDPLIGKITRQVADRKTAELKKSLAKAEETLARVTKKNNSILEPKKLTKLDEAALIRREILKIQSDLTDSNTALAGMLGARRAAKAATRKRIEFPEDKMLQEGADLLWNNADSISRQIAKLAGIDEADVFTGYFPRILKDKATIKEFAGGRHMSALGKTKDDRLKMFSGALKEEDVITDAAKAFKMTELEIVSSRLKADALQAIYAAFGKQADGMTSAEMRDLGFTEFKRTILGKDYKGWIPKEIEKQVNEFFEPHDNTADEIANSLGFDWSTGMFKSWSTAFFPAFQFMNFVGNQFNLLMKIGINSANVPRFMETTQLSILSLPDDSMWKKAYVSGRKKLDGFNEEEFMNKFFTTQDGRKISNREFIDMIKKETDILDSGMYNNYEQGIKTIGRETSNNPLSLEWGALHTAREFGQTWEVQAKLMAIQDRMIAGGTVKEGIKDAEDAIFNYQKLTDVEKTYLRRVIPFYTFARKNFEFQLKMLSSNPGRVATQFKLMNNMNSSMGYDKERDEDTGIPQYVLNKMTIRAGADGNGDEQVMSGFGLPIEEFLGRFSGPKSFGWNAMDNVIKMTNPILKFQWEKATGVDLFKGRPIAELDDGQGVRYMIDAMGGPDSKLGEQFADMIGYKEVDNLPVYDSYGNKTGTYTRYLANPIFMHWWRNLPTSRLSNTASFLSDGDVELDKRIGRFLTGVQFTTIEAEKAEYIAKLEKKEDLTRWLERNGIIKSKEIFYKPK